ncbi:amidohydrolase family protein [Fimbriimonas ginsengisoli]|uniref:Amidohydrolase n=1 Tax=Fimbriimonas ginsengisoli Gsoil 348 TaxID=661478 RepID=A0A068NP39_FIMGI|nr:amidohydrolase family protein [Fimbriimonas ginsengisoli]AIE85206.1 amidohydrolase [Fimbriimonas ginsengisoli Gsoil 348]
MLSLLLLVAAQTPPWTESWRLYKYEQPIGQETAAFKPHPLFLTQIQTDFAFTDRSSPVKLTASITTVRGAVTELTVKGQTARPTTINREIHVHGNEATWAEKGIEQKIAVPAKYAVSSGYAPIAGQEAMLQYWNSIGRPSSLANLPSGQIHVEVRGTDSVKVAGKSVNLTRYGVDGVMWGRETLWTDPHGRLVAGVMCDAEFDHFEALAPGYEPLLGIFVRRAAEDAMARLAQLSRRLSPKVPKAIAFVGGRLIDGRGGKPIEDSTVVVRGGQILAAGPRISVTIPPDTEKVDIRGKSILPGLWDMHAHYAQVEWGPVYLASGVTTVRDCGNEFDFVVPVRDAIDRGAGLGPRLLLAGLVDGTSPMSLGVVRVDNMEQVRAAVAKYKAAGFRQMKIYSSVKPEMVRAVAEVAHRAGMTVTGHIPEGMTLQEGVESGMDQVNHFQYVVSAIAGNGGSLKPLDPNSPRTGEVIQFLRSHRTVMDDTMVLFSLFIHAPVKSPSEVEPGVDKVAPELKTAMRSMVSPGAPPFGKLMDSWLAVLGKMHRAGIPIVAGTDQAIPGHSLHGELELYVRAGFTPLEAIQAATSVPAKVMGLDRQVGTVTAAKRADLLVVDGDPSKRISDTRKVWLVLANGRPYRPKPLWQAVGFTP